MVDIQRYSNVTSTVSPVTTNQNNSGRTVHDMDYDVLIRMICLYMIIIIGLIGGILVIVWMWFNRRKRSRVNFLILNLTIADLLVVFFGCMAQLFGWEYTERRWSAGDAMCRIVKFLQGTSLMSSSYMLVVLAMDRHQAIRSPLREPWPARNMALVGWITSMLLAFPNFFLFHTKEVHSKIQCENIFRGKPMAARQTWVMYALIFSFFIPLIVLTVCYVRIFIKIAEKASESTSNCEPMRPGKIQLTCNQGSSLPRAKIKTLKMTFVIVSAFIFFGLPYFICEMFMSFGDFNTLSKPLYGVLGSLAPANSAINPYVFLMFSANSHCLHGLCPCCPEPRDSQRHKFSRTSDRSEMTMLNPDSRRLTTRVSHGNAMEMDQLYR